MHLVNFAIRLHATVSLLRLKFIVILLHIKRVSVELTESSKAETPAKSSYDLKLFNDVQSHNWSGVVLQIKYIVLFNRFKPSVDCVYNCL